jgi:predicted membrane-bound mannosyltransferase
MRIIHTVPDGVLASARRALPALAIILLASAIRVGLIAAGWPGTDSDDSTMGLIALHILTHGERPILFYGQAYMGTIEAYLGALMFAIFGVSLFALKLGLVLLYAAFMAVMYLLLAGLFTRRWALAGLLLLSLGADAMLFQQLNAYGG